MKALRGFLLLFFFFYDVLMAFVRFFVPLPKKSFAGKIVLVTGAGHGIGRELALQFSALGAQLVLWDINKTNNDSVAEEVRMAGGTATTYECDVRKLKEVEAVADKVKREVGEVDVLVNNAGIIVLKRFLDLSEDEIRRVMDVNIMSQFWTGKQFLPAMMKKNSGHVINIASMAGKAGIPYMTDYCASKHAVVGMTLALGNELKQEGYNGVHCTVVCPMFVNTGLVPNRMVKNSEILSPAIVAGAIIEGAQRNQKHVFIPANMEASVRVGPLFPQRFVERMLDFKDIGVDMRKKES